METQKSPWVKERVAEEFRTQIRLTLACAESLCEEVEAALQGQHNHERWVFLKQRTEILEKMINNLKAQMAVYLD